MCTCVNRHKFHYIIYFICKIKNYEAFIQKTSEACIKNILTSLEVFINNNIIHNKGIDPKKIML